MKIYDLPLVWDAAKFAARYGLDAIHGEFYVNGEGKLAVFPNLPDDPPIFDPPDPPGPPKPTLDELAARVAALEAKVR